MSILFNLRNGFLNELNSNSVDLVGWRQTKRPHPVRPCHRQTVAIQLDKL